MASTLELIFAFFSVGIFVGAFLIFIRKYRKLGLRLLLASTVVSFGVFSVQEERWSRKFGSAFKVDRMMKVTIQNEEKKEPFA